MSSTINSWIAGIDDVTEALQRLDHLFLLTCRDEWGASPRHGPFPAVWYAGFRSDPAINSQRCSYTTRTGKHLPAAVSWKTIWSFQVLPLEIIRCHMRMSEIIGSFFKQKDALTAAPFSSLLEVWGVHTCCIIFTVILLDVTLRSPMLGEPGSKAGKVSSPGSGSTL